MQRQKNKRQETVVRLSFHRKYVQRVIYDTIRIGIGINKTKWSYSVRDSFAWNDVLNARDAFIEYLARHPVCTLINVLQ